MCKITFSNIIQQNSLRKGLLQLVGQDGHYEDFFKEISTDGSQENSQECLEQVQKKMNSLIQTQILAWFEVKNIHLGNPDDLIYRSIQKKKAIILPKKEEVNGVSGNQLKMNNLLSRRKAKLIEVNVSG